MDTTTNVDRERRFILRALASLAPLGCTPAALTRASEHPETIALARIPEPVFELGRLYLDRFGDDADRETLRHRLGLDDPSLSEAEQVNRLNKAILAEIEAEDFVDIAGWQLARTECRVYALVVLDVERSG